MGDWIDFRELRGKLNFRDVFEKYGLRFQIRAGGKQAVGPCPLPSHSGSRKKQSFSANLESGVFQCFSCGARGNLIDFACLVEGRNPENGSDLRKVALELAEYFKIPRTSSQGREPLKKKRQRAEDQSDPLIVNAPLDFELKGLDPTHEYLRGRKLTPETIKTFGLGYCCRGYFKMRIAIPIHTQTGALVGYAGRVVDDSLITGENPKYLLPGTREHRGITYEFRKSLLLYNAHRLKAPVENLTVVEGFASVWWFHQHGFPNCVSVMGNHMSEEQKTIALSLLEERAQIILVTDGDEGGRKLASQAEDLFKSDRRFRAIRLEDGRQPTDLDPATLSDCFREWREVPAGIGGGFSPKEDICELIGRFPCLKHLRITPDIWDAEIFERQTGKFSSGELSVAQFILGVWNPTTAWKCGKFDLIEAAARLDDEHRQVITDWFSDPWWP